MKLCCRHIIGEVRDIPSPFDRLVATGYYDGPTDGLVECGTCGRLYAFEKIDWDDGQNLRIFSLAPVGGSFADIEDHASVKPGWPTWILNADGEVGELVQQASASSSRAEFVVASRDLLKVVEVWSPAGLQPGVDWFIQLRCPRRNDGA